MANVPVKKASPLKGKGGLIMTGAVVLLGILFYFEQKAPPPHDPDSPPPISDFMHMTSADVKRVELKRDKDSFVLVKQGDRWSFESPGRFRANADSVKSWLKGLLEDNNVSQPMEKPADNAVTGLDKPALQLVLTTLGGDVRALQIGKQPQLPGATSPLYYAREGKDGRQFLLSATQVDGLKDKKIGDLRDKRLVDLPEDKEIRKITLQGEDGTVEIDRQGDDKWQMTQPFRAAADKTSVEGELLGQLRSAEAASFVDSPSPNLAQYGLDKPRLTIRVGDRKGTHGVLFGSADKDGKVYCVREGETEVTLVPKDTFARLNKKPADLRDRSLVTYERDKITFLEVKNSHGDVRLQKSRNLSVDQWQIQAAAGSKQEKAKADAVERVIDTLTAPASKFIEDAPKDLAKYGLDKPEITVTANDGHGTSQILAIGKKTKDGYFARGVQNAVFEVQSFVYTDFNVTPEAFKDTGGKK